MAAQKDIASRLRDLYSFFIFIGYVREDQICWPPHSSEDLNIDDCRAKGYSESAITVLQNLPWSKNDPDLFMNLIRKSQAVNYSDH